MIQTLLFILGAAALCFLGLMLFVLLLAWVYNLLDEDPYENEEEN